MYAENENSPTEQSHGWLSPASGCYMASHKCCNDVILACLFFKLNNRSVLNFDQPRMVFKKQIIIVNVNYKCYSYIYKVKAIIS